MKRKLLKVSRVTSFAGVLLLLAIGFSLFVSAEALASKSATIATQFNCNVDCDSTQTTCNKGCCGPFGLLCSGTCINSCQTKADACKLSCANAAIGATSATTDFFDTATIGPEGRIITLGGPLSCSEGGTADLQVTLTQHNGAIAKGSTKIQCPNVEERAEYSFTLDVRTTGGVNFQVPGTALACGIRRIGAANITLDAWQWCREITILPEGVELQSNGE